ACCATVCNGDDACPPRGSSRRVPEAGRLREDAAPAHVCGDRQRALRVPADGQHLHGAHHDQELQHPRGPRDASALRTGDSRILPLQRGGGRTGERVRPDLRLRRDRRARLPRERQSRADPHLHRDGLARGARLQPDPDCTATSRAEPDEREGEGDEARRKAQEDARWPCRRLHGERHRDQLRERAPALLSLLRLHERQLLAAGGQLIDEAEVHLRREGACGRRQGAEAGREGYHRRLLPPTASQRGPGRAHGLTREGEPKGVGAGLDGQARAGAHEVRGEAHGRSHARRRARVLRGKLLIRRLTYCTSYLQILGTMSLNIADHQRDFVCVKVRNQDKSGAKLQVHPNLDKKAWKEQAVLKSAQKVLPKDVDFGVLRWRVEIKDEDELPLSVTCWANESPDGYVVNAQYTLQRTDMQLNNVVITIPLPPATAPVVSECEGNYEYVRSSSQLVWSLDVVDGSSETGSLEFSVPNGRAEHFFPVNVTYASQDLYCDLKAEDVTTADGSESIPFSAELVVNGSVEIRSK
ncbi:putative coatomer delta subunit, partial [Aphelenchoides avenae]